MRSKEEVLADIKKLKAQLEPLEKELNEVCRTDEKLVEDKLKRCETLTDKFTEDELVFAATARCTCGAGLAYPKNIGIHGSWHCSDILLGLALSSDKPDSKVHDSGYPFSFYNIKSDQQPSAEGQTTRRKKEEA